MVKSEIVQILVPAGTKGGQLIDFKTNYFVVKMIFVGYFSLELKTDRQTERKLY